MLELLKDIGSALMLIKPVVVIIIALIVMLIWNRNKKQK